MHILCIICSELLKNDDDVCITLCGHCFHRNCIMEWMKNSQTCPNCRQAVSTKSLIKVYFENDLNRSSDLHNELLKTNDKLTKELDEIKKNATSKEIEFNELTRKYQSVTENIKTLEREKQLDEMNLAGLRMIKEESAKEILKLSSQVSILKLDLLAERELRRIHQKKLQELDPENDNYNIKSITIDSKNEEVTSNISITPFWKLSTEAKKVTEPSVKKDSHSYIIPSKIQKACDNKSSIKYQLKNFRQKRSSSREEDDGTGPYFPYSSTSSHNNSKNGNNRSTSPFHFGSTDITRTFSFGSNSSNQDQPSTSNQNPFSQSTSNFTSYRDMRPDRGIIDSPRPSER